MSPHRRNPLQIRATYECVYYFRNKLTLVNVDSSLLGIDSLLQQLPKENLSLVRLLIAHLDWRLAALAILIPANDVLTVLANTFAPIMFAKTRLVSDESRRQQVHILGLWFQYSWFHWASFDTLEA
jgi:hypothetical protein